MIRAGCRSSFAAIQIAALVALIGCGSTASVAGSTIDSKTPRIEAVRGQFVSDGVAIDEFHCAPRAEGRHPVVMLLHGCAPEGFGAGEFHQMCLGLAARGYFATFIEYYGAAGGANCSDLAMIPAVSLAPQTEIPDATWMHELMAARTALVKNPQADTTRIALVGFSFGATLAVITAALNPNTIDAVVDYYGYSNAKVEDAVAQLSNFPPTLILQGDADRRAHVADSIHLHNVIAKHQPGSEVRVYPGVGHGFNFREAPGYDQEASEDAWSHALSFLDRHLK
jgi:dienelactone hydrolase